MISIIICSRSPEKLTAVSKNIKETVGIACELVDVDNSANRYSICSAYNSGAARASFSYLCFVHEDVRFVTVNWGKKIIDFFNENSEAGLVGVAGGVYKTRVVSGWGQSEDGWQEHKRMNISHPQNNLLKHIYINPLNENKSEVVSVDGVFLATKMDVWHTNKFDEKLLKGFHGYDLDFSLQVRQTKKIYVVYDILLEHFSGGKYDATWLEELLKVHKKWRQKLPAIANGYAVNIGAVYADGWKRIRKNIALYADDRRGFAETLKMFYALLLLLDHRPTLPVLVADLATNLLKTTSLLLKKNKTA